jgi:hypothetical protein
MSKKHVKMGGVEVVDSTPATKVSIGHPQIALKQMPYAVELKSEWRKILLKCRWSYDYYGGRHS